MAHLRLMERNGQSSIEVFGGSLTCTASFLLNKEYFQWLNVSSFELWTRTLLNKMQLEMSRIFVDYVLFFLIKCTKFKWSFDPSLSDVYRDHSAWLFSVFLFYYLWIYRWTHFRLQDHSCTCQQMSATICIFIWAPIWLVKHFFIRIWQQC